MGATFVQFHNRSATAMDFPSKTCQRGHAAPKLAAQRVTRVSPDGREAWLQWFVTSKNDGSAIGSIDACVDQDKVAVNFGYYLFVHAWGQGFATEAVAAVTVGNAASVRVLEKVGFLYTRTIADNDTVNGRLVDDDEFVLTTDRLPASQCALCVVQ